jgi:hypothetical protein
LLNFPVFLHQDLLIKTELLFKNLLSKQKPEQIFEHRKTKIEMEMKSHSFKDRQPVAEAAAAVGFVF